MPNARELKGDEETKTHTWVIRYLGNYRGEWTSPTFSIFGGDEQKFQLSLRSNRFGKILILRCMEQVTLPTWCMYKISIVANDRMFEIGTGNHTFVTFRSEKEIFNFNSADLDSYQTKGSLTFACRLLNPKSLFLDEDSSDVLLRTASGEELPAHRFILAMANPTFNDMMCQEMVDNMPRTTHAIDVDHDVAVEMLRYIYLCEISTECELNLIGKIFQTAESYQMEGLRNECERKLIDAVRPENVMGILKWADTHNVTRLKEAAVYQIEIRLQEPRYVDEKCDILLGKYVQNSL